MTRESSDLAVALDARIDQAAAALDAAAGSSSLCTLSRAGVPMPGIKYPEGVWSALREVAREVRSSGEPCSAARAVRERWGRDLAVHAARGSGPDWIAYLTGGVDSLDGFLTEECSSSQAC